MKKRRRLRLKKKVKKFLRMCFYIIVLVLIILIVLNVFKHREDVILNNTPDVIELTIKDKDIYLIKGEELKIAYSDKYDYKINDNGVITFEKGIIKAINAGTASIHVSTPAQHADLKIYVTDVLVSANIDNSKEYLGCHVYNEEQAELLDKTLEYRINEKGYKTRAGAVESMRFLLLNFPYRLKYFFENGRLDRSNPLVDEDDGEGRFYHKGLYLTDNKKSLLKISRQTPQPWGCPIYNETRKTENNNGFDCSGLISWALYNAGYDPGDIGAGINNYNDLTDLGTVVYFTDNRAFEKVKVGDLIGRNGHIGMIIGKDDSKYYVGEALDKGEFDLHVYAYTKDELINSEFKYFVYMDSFYTDDGNLTNMW